ncbi:MAG: hypothetical protein ACRYFA_03495 [Janthinobacterium lividum]
MILQLLAENAVEHGIALLPGGVKISVSAQKMQDGICLSVKREQWLINAN